MRRLRPSVEVFSPIRIGLRPWAGLVGVLAPVFAVMMVLMIGGTVLVSPAPRLGTPMAMTTGLDPDERAYVEFVQPRLSALETEAAGLAALGKARSQNVVALLQGQRRLEDLIADISEYVEERGIPVAFRGSASEFLVGAQRADASIQDGRTALARLDWERLEDAVIEFSSAAGAFKSANTKLAREADQAAM